MRTSDSEQNGGDGSFGRARQRVRGRLLATGVASVAVLAAGAAVGACSLIVDTNADQCATKTVQTDCKSFPGFRACNTGVCEATTTVPLCKTDSDCSKYAQATCDVPSGTCTRPCSGDEDCGITGLTCGANGKCGGTTGCTANADCSTAMGPDFICRKGKCVTHNLTVGGQSLCTTLYATKSPASAAYQDDTAVIFGSILPTAANADGPYGHLVEDSIKLALDDLGKADGLPGLTGAGNRPIVLVGCNDGPNEDQTDVVAKHLINDLAVPAIIGYAFSGSTISVAQDVTIPDKTLLFSPSATSAGITALETTDNALVWRDCPSDNVQAQAQLLLFPSVVAAAEARYPSIDKSNVKVAIVNHMDAYGSGLGDTVQMNLSFNGMTAVAQSGTNYLRVDYGPSGNPDLSKVATITAFAPDIIFLFGFNEAVDKIFTQVEAQWPMPLPDGHYPFWILSDGDEVSSLWASTTMPATPADIKTEDQRQRVIGTVPGTNSSSWTPYGTFLTEFSSSTYFTADGSADTIGPAGAYDAMFLFAFSTVMVGKNPLTGPNMIKLGLQKMQKTTGLPKIQISNQTADILNAFNAVSGDMPVNVQGVSGPLPFNGKGDITTADIQIWCVPPSSGGTDVGTAANNSGYFYDSNATPPALTGCISAMCMLPNYAKPVSCQ